MFCLADQTGVTRCVTHNVAGVLHEENMREKLTTMSSWLSVRSDRQPALWSIKFDDNMIMFYHRFLAP